MEFVGEQITKIVDAQTSTQGIVIKVFKNQEESYAKIEYDDKSVETITLKEAMTRIRASDSTQEIKNYQDSQDLTESSISSSFDAGNNGQQTYTEKNEKCRLSSSLYKDELKKIIKSEGNNPFNLSIDSFYLFKIDQQKIKTQIDMVNEGIYKKDFEISKKAYENNILKRNSRKRIRKDDMRNELILRNSDICQFNDMSIEKYHLKETCPVLDLLSKFEIGAQVYFPHDWKRRAGTCNPQIKRSIPRPAKTIRYLVQSGLTRVGEKVVYCGGHGKVMAEGWIANSGILCARCGYIIGSTEFEKCAGMRVRKPGKHICFLNGSSLLELTRLLNQISDTDQLKKIYNTH